MWKDRARESDVTLVGKMIPTLHGDESRWTGARVLLAEHVSAYEGKCEAKATDPRWMIHLLDRRAMQHDGEAKAFEHGKEHACARQLAEEEAASVAAREARRNCSNSADAPNATVWVMAHSARSWQQE